MPNDPPAEQVRQFAAWLAGTDIARLELHTPRGVLVVRRDGTAVNGPETEATPESDAPTATHAVTAPSVGMFLHRHPMRHEIDDPPLARVARVVRAGEIVGFLRIGTLLLPVRAPHDGVIAEVTAAHAEIVGYGTTLMHLTRD